MRDDGMLSDPIRDLFVVLHQRGSSTQSRLPRVVVIGNYGNGNTGDEAILAGLADAAAGLADLRVLAKDPAQVPDSTDLTVVGRRSLGAFRQLLTADVVAIGGGGMFGFGMPRLVKLLPWVGLGLVLLGKEVVFLAIGAYPDMGKVTGFALQRLAAHAFAITVREEVTAEFLSRRLRPGSARPITVADPAGRVIPASVDEITRELGCEAGLLANSLVISLKPSASDDVNRSMVDAAAVAADAWFTVTGRHVIYVCMSAQGDFGLDMEITDLSLARRAIACHRTPLAFSVLGPNLSPRVAKGVIAAGGAVLAARLHTVIFAANEQVPAFGLVFEIKMKQYLNDIGAPSVTLPTAEMASIGAWITEVASRVDA